MRKSTPKWRRKASLAHGMHRAGALSSSERSGALHGNPLDARGAVVRSRVAKSVLVSSQSLRTNWTMTRPAHVLHTSTAPMPRNAGVRFAASVAASVGIKDQKAARAGEVMHAPSAAHGLASSRLASVSACSRERLSPMKSTGCGAGREVSAAQRSATVRGSRRNASCVAEWREEHCHSHRGLVPVRLCLDHLSSHTESHSKCA